MVELAAPALMVAALVAAGALVVMAWRMRN